MPTHFRCRHCRGFYDATLPHCAYCGKDIPIKNTDGSPKSFPDRETCRSIQIAEYEQLPPEAHKDHMRPDPELLDKLCYCLHCGQDAQSFEAVEMRWIVNERMWACPCTTCGGRGFLIDIHLAERLWQCAECEHWYAPPDNDFRHSNAKCPKCGSTFANGWFDDETDEEEDELVSEELSAESPLEENAETFADESVPWTDDNEEVGEGLFGSDAPSTDKGMADDIDFPRVRPESPSDGGLPGEDDIPW